MDAWSGGVDTSEMAKRAMTWEGSCENMHVLPARQLPLRKYLGKRVNTMTPGNGQHCTYLHKVLVVSWLNLQSALAHCPEDRKYLQMMLLFA